MTPEWAGRLRLAMRLGLGPEPFWRLSLAEWRALTAAPDLPVLGRDALEAMIASHPDGIKDDRHDR